MYGLATPTIATVPVVEGESLSTAIAKAISLGARWALENEQTNAEGIDWTPQFAVDITEDGNLRVEVAADTYDGDIHNFTNILVFSYGMDLCDPNSASWAAKLVHGIILTDEYDLVHAYKVQTDTL